MSLRKNILASYASQIYVTLIGVVLLPVYIRYMGVEAYGLVGFYTMLLAWFQMLDFGLAPTLSREVARYVGGAVDGLTLRRLLRVLEAVFFSVALAGALTLLLGADWVASSWLRIEHLPPGQVRTAIRLMAIIIALRWVAALYRAAIGGFEQQVWLGGLNAAIATARSVLVVPLFALDTTPEYFFGYQLIVAVVETALLAARTYRLMPSLPEGERIGFHWRPLHGVLRFSLSIAFTGAVWIGMTQIDKLLLSKLLPLAEYAQFTLAVLVAGGVLIVSGPLSTALLPRLSRLHAQGDEQGLIALYRQATQGMAVIAMPVALVLACGAEPLLRAWTGDGVLAANAAPVLRLYALGNGILALSAFPYYLQFAKGDLRLHLAGNALFLMMFIPAIWLATTHYGAQGAGWAWLGANVVYALAWVPLVHRRFAPGLHRLWLFADVLPITAAVICASLLLLPFLSASEHRVATVVLLFTGGLVAHAAALAASSQARTWILNRTNR